MRTIGDNSTDLYVNATALLAKAERRIAACSEMASSDDYKRGHRDLAVLRLTEYRADADTLRRLIDYAFS